MSSHRLRYSGRSLPLAEPRTPKGSSHIDSSLNPPTLSPPRHSARTYPPHLAFSTTTDLPPIQSHEGIYAHQKWAHPTRPLFPPPSQPQRSVSEDQSLAPKPKRKRITPIQLSVLSSLFEITDTPSFDVREDTGAKLGMTNREVQIWFQNRRAKANRQKAAAADASPTSGKSQMALARTEERLPQDPPLSEIASCRSGQGGHLASTSYYQGSASTHDKCGIQSQVPRAASYTQKHLATLPRETRNPPVMSPQARYPLNPHSLLFASQHGQMPDASAHEAQSPSSTYSGETETDSHSPFQTSHQSLAGPHRHDRTTRRKTYSSCSPFDSASCYVSKRSAGIDEEQFHYPSHSSTHWRETGNEKAEERFRKECNTKDWSSRVHLPSASSGSSHGGYTSHVLGCEETLSPSDIELETPPDALVVSRTSRNEYHTYPIPKSGPHISKNSMPLLSTQSGFFDLKSPSETRSRSSVAASTSPGAFKPSALVGSRHLPPLPLVKCPGPGSFPPPSCLPPRSSHVKQEYDASLTLAPLMSLPALRDSLPRHKVSNQRLPSWRRSDPESNSDRLSREGS